MKKVIITAPSLDPSQNVSGVSSVAQFIIDNNPEYSYQHFELGKKDKEKRGVRNVTRLLKCYYRWKRIINESGKGRGGGITEDKFIVHYSFPLNTPSIIRDPFFMNYARKHRAKMVVHIHGGLFLTASNIPFVLKVILKWVFSWDVPFVVLSEFEKDVLQKKFGARNVEVLPNCVDLRDAKAFYEVKKGNQRHVNDIPLRLGYLGRIEPLKGMTELLEACKKIKKNGVPFKLILAGKEKHEGEYLPLFESELNDENCRCFEYAGLVSGDSKCQFLRNIDAFVMPSYFEGLPMSLLECMSYGVVPIITPVGSVPTIVDGYSVGDNVEKANGLFVKIKDVDSIIEAIELLNNNRDLVRVLGDNARQTIFNNFSTEKYITKLNGIYSNLLNN